MHLSFNERGSQLETTMVFAVSGMLNPAIAASYFDFASATFFGLGVFILYGIYKNSVSINATINSFTDSITSWSPFVIPDIKNIIAAK